MTSLPLIDRSLARSLARDALGAGTGAVLYVDRLPRPAGGVAAGAETVSTDRRTIVAFRDDMPGANWMHPCTYALIDLETGALVATVPAVSPPAFGRLPDTWIVAADPDGRADLIPLDPHPKEQP